MRVLEEKMIADNKDTQRIALNKANAELIRHNKVEEKFLRQKAGLKWFVEGETNSKFYHSVIKGKRKRMQLSRMKKEDGTWVEGEQQLTEVAVTVFQKQFRSETISKGYFNAKLYT